MTLVRSATFAAILGASVITLHAEPPRGSLTIDRIADIRYPTNPVWSPDGKRIAFLWDAAGKQDLFVVTPGDAPIRLTDFQVDPNTLLSDISRVSWITPDRILFAKDRQLWSVSLASPRPVLITGLGDAADYALSHDKKEIAFVRRGQIWTASLAAKTERQVTQLGDGLVASAIVFSRDDKSVAFTAARAAVQPMDLPFNGPWIRQFHNVTSERRRGVVSLYEGDPVWLTAAGELSALQWTADESVLYQELSADKKTRTIRVWQVAGAPRTLWTDHDPAWWTASIQAGDTVVSPDGKSVVFASDRTGWTHLYVIPIAAASESQARALTSGKFTAGFGSWSPDGRRIAYYHSAVGNDFERFISTVEVVSGKSDAIVTSHGVALQPLFSPDGANLVFQQSAVDHALDLFAVPSRPGASAVRLTDSMPAAIVNSDLTPPVPVSFPSRVDGRPVPGTLIVSKQLDRSTKHPAIVWIHGSGLDQNYLGWHPDSYRMYYAMHQYLAQQGYVILTPDPRGGSGHGRDWATGNYMDVGGSEYLDVASGADYLKSLPYVDPDRIGVWGLSYGGFLTLQAVTVTPTLFRCAIDVSGVTDWETHLSTLGPGRGFARMGTPVENPDGYNRSAPVKHMDRLERPLLVLHGTNDTNVPFRETLTLVDTLLKLGKPFELAVYPGEIHFFRRGFVLRDAWRRVEDFFDRHLKGGATMVSK